MLTFIWIGIYLTFFLSWFWLLFCLGWFLVLGFLSFFFLTFTFLLSQFGFFWFLRIAGPSRYWLQRWEKLQCNTFFNLPNKKRCCGWNTWKTSFYSQMPWRVDSTKSAMIIRSSNKQLLLPHCVTTKWKFTEI